jgi:hypothetical protein
MEQGQVQPGVDEQWRIKLGEAGHCRPFGGSHPLHRRGTSPQPLCLPFMTAVQSLALPTTHTESMKPLAARQDAKELFVCLWMHCKCVMDSLIVILTVISGGRAQTPTLATPQ